MVEEKKERRILDAELEKEIRGMIAKDVKLAVSSIDKTKKTIEETADETAEEIRKKPFAWVGGAFVGGLLLGKLLSK